MHPGGHRNCRFDGVAHLGRSGLRRAAWPIAGFQASAAQHFGQRDQFSNSTNN